MYVEIVLYFEDVARDVVFTLEYTLCDFIDPPEYSPVGSYDPIKPDLEPTAAINGEMTTSEMLQAALDNYYGADFALQKKNGSTETSIMQILVEQLVESVTIRDGAADGDHSIYMRNQSATLSGSLPFDVRYWDEIDYIKSGSTEEVYHRIAARDNYEVETIYDKHGVLDDWWLGWTEGESYASPTKFTSLNSFVAQNSFDPTAILMYDLSEQNITTMTDPVYHADKGTYTFDVTLSADAAANYAEWWRAVLDANEQSPSEMEFTSVTLKFEIWDNGFLKSVTAQDNFYIKMLGLIDCNAVLETKTNFYFERDNLPSAGVDDAFDTDRLGSVKEYYDTVGGTEVPDDDAFDVNGKTFLFDHCEIEGGTGETVEEALEFGNDEYYNVWLSFNDGVMSCNYDVFVGSYTQNGNTLTYTNEYVQDQIAMIEDGKLYVRVDDGSMDGVKLYMVMLLVDEGISTDYSVAGKTFTIVSCDIPYVTPEQEQALMDEEGWTVDDYLARVSETFLGFELSFASDGSVTTSGGTGTYTYMQDGNLTIELPDAGLSMDGDVRIDGEIKLRFLLDLDIQIFVTAQVG